MNSPIKILGVDDRAVNLLALEAVLEPLAITFVQANSGQKALEMIFEQDFALILLDVQMPDMDGFETAVHIRSNKRSANTPIIFVTAISIDKKHIFKGYESGAVDYLLKPIDPVILVSKVKVFIELHQQRKAAENREKELEKANLRILEQQQVLKENETRFRAAFDQSFQFMAILDSEGRVIEINSLARERFCTYTRDIEGKPLWDMLSLAGEKERKQLQHKIEMAASTDASNDEILFLTVNGDEAIVLCDISPVMDESGHVVYITMQGQDITQRKYAQEEKLQIEVQLRQAQKMESIGTLAGGIAHDFNNILTSIIGFTELALLDLDAFEKRTKLGEYLQEIRTAGIRARDLVKQILTFARQSDESIKPIQASIIVKEVLKLVTSSIPTTIQINTNLNSDSLIMGSPTQVHQIFMNILTNAAQAMEEKGGILDISMNDLSIDRKTISELKPGDYIEIKVTDNGIGISPQNIHTIFEPYFTTKPVGKGTGLGLAVVHGIVEKYGGKITVESTKGKGTSFTIYLPITEKRKVYKHSEKETLLLGKEKILFVDDEVSIAKMGGIMLKELGYSVTTKTSSVEALEVFRSNPQAFDLVITDMTMPNMTGDKLAIELMNIDPDIPVILYTGYSNKISEESAADIGIKALEYKPIVAADLAKTVRNVLDKV